jgi:2-polyprenyl-3-methyl-5-hydroxy-6-metoxy-1,4-benzoquinol methylase
LKIYARNGYQVEGLELNETAAVARRRGFSVRTEALENFTTAAPFGVIVLSNVLEHSLNPTQMLRDVRRLLEPGGQSGLVARTTGVGCALFSAGTRSTGTFPFISSIFRLKHCKSR